MLELHRIPNAASSVTAVLSETAFWRSGPPVGCSDLVDIVMDTKLYPGLAVIYEASLRYSNAPPGMFTIDMFDAWVKDEGDQVSASFSTRRMQGTDRPGGRQMHTVSMMREQFPAWLEAKISTLSVVLSTLRAEGSGPGFNVFVPKVGVAYTTGAYWVYLTKEECDGS